MKKLKAWFYVRKGYSHQDRREFEAAECCFLKALSILEGLGNIRERKVGIALQRSNLGLLYHQQGKINDAVINLKTAIEIYNALDRIDDCAPLYGSLGKAYYDNRDISPAEKALKKALEIYTRRGDATEAIALINELLSRITNRSNVE